MREMLEPVFGETGAIIAQFVITLVVVLLLIAVVVWLVRRYSGGAFAAGGRGRLPRLAIVDAMAVDNRRRLVLVRRDNVEHLLLIGGPSDIVVEPAILRTRTAAARTPQQAEARPAVPSGPAPARMPAPSVQPAARAAPPAPVIMPEAPPAPPLAAEAPALAAASAGAARHGRVGVDHPIPFPPRRSPAPRPPLRREPEEAPAAVAAPESRNRSRFAPAGAPPSAPPPSEEPGLETIFPVEEEAPPVALSEPEPEAAAESPTEGFTPPLPEEENYAPPEATGEGAGEVVEIVAESPAIAAAEADEAAAEEPAPAAGTRVSDLEKEMARLLGEISGRR